MAETDSLSARTIERLRSYAKGNGLDPRAIELVDSQEAVYRLTAQIKLTAKSEIRTSSGFGPVSGKDRHVLSDFSALDAEVQKIKGEFHDKGSWIDSAIKEVEAAPGHGWGQSGARITLPGQDMILAAQETCTACRGSAQVPCVQCAGESLIQCPYCVGRGQETCPNCFGNGVDPTNPNNPCPLCHGTRQSQCHACRGNGRIPCPNCQGRGGTPCPDCRGHGSLNREVFISNGASVDFTMGSTKELPTGLLRAIEKIGEPNLHKGHADIEMKAKPPDPESRDDRSVIDLTADVPYADITAKIGSTQISCSAFGKLGRLSGIPPFLDQTLLPARQALVAAARGTGSLEEATKARLMAEALTLTLKGRPNPNDLRRLYPIGFSGEAAGEIMRNMSLALRNVTQSSRRIAATLTVLIFGGLFSYLFFTPTFTNLTRELTPRTIRLVEFGIPILAVALCALALLLTAKITLSSKYPGAQVAKGQSIGRTGYIAMGLILALYFAILLLVGRFH